MVLVVAGLAGVFFFVPARPVAGLVAWILVLAGAASYALIRSWSSWRRRPSYIRMGNNQLTARRGDGSVIAEIPYSAISGMRDNVWAGSLVIHGADGYSRIEIPLATQGISNLLLALSERIPAYLWDLESARSFRMSGRPRVLLALAALYLVAAGCFYYVESYWLAGIGAASALAGLAVVLLAPRGYEVTRNGVTVRRILGARFVPAAEVTAVQLKKDSADAGMRLYVKLLLQSGKQLALGGTEQSAVVLYRALLSMRKATL